MRFVFVLLTMLLTAGMAAPTLADDVAPPGDPELTTPDGLTEDNYVEPSDDDAVPCGCGGPKAIYAAKYGTVQPPAMQQQQQEREAAEAAAAAAEAAQSQ